MSTNVATTSAPAKTETTITQAELLERIREHCINMQIFFDLSEREILFHNSTDFDGLEFLIKAVKDETLLFDNFVFALETGGEA